MLSDKCSLSRQGRKKERKERGEEGGGLMVLIIIANYLKRVARAGGGGRSGQPFPHMPRHILYRRRHAALSVAAGACATSTDTHTCAKRVWREAVGLQRVAPVNQYDKMDQDVAATPWQWQNIPACQSHHACSIHDHLPMILYTTA